MNVFPTTLEVIRCSHLASPSSHRPLSWRVCRNETTREVALSPSLEILNTRLDNILNNLIRPHCWTYFEQEIGVKTSSGPFRCHLSCHPLVVLTPGEKGRPLPCCPTEHLEGNRRSSQEQGITIRPSANRVSELMSIKTFLLVSAGAVLG